MIVRSDKKSEKKDRVSKINAMIKKTTKTTVKKEHRFNKEKQEVFLSIFKEIGNVSLSCLAAGIDRGTAYRWKKKDKAFAEKWMDASEDAADMLKEEARKRAMDKSDNLLMFLLKSLKPEVYRERYEHTGPEGKPIQVQIYLPENFRDRTKPAA